MIEAIQAANPCREVPIHGRAAPARPLEEAAVFRYGHGFANAIVRTWLR